MKLIVLLLCLAVGFFSLLTAAEKDGMIYYQMENGRFYGSAPLNPEATLVVAVGQRSGKKHKKEGKKKQGQKGSKEPKEFKRKGYVAVLALENNSLTPAAEDTFAVSYKGRKYATRVRTVAVVNQADTTEADIYISGRGGTDTVGIGFIRHYTWKNKTLTHTKTIVMEQKEEGIVYTHGYSLKTGDINGDGTQEAIYGGFYGKDINEHLSEDFTDVRVFEKTAEGSIRQSKITPFDSFKIPLRINALEVKDINGDSKAEIIIAGRSRMGDFQYASFAMWSVGRVTYHVNREHSLPGRFRTVLAADINGDGKDELITGGRVDMGERMIADVQVWKLEPQGVKRLACYTWTSDVSTRFRVLAPTAVNGQFLAAGRTELLHSSDSSRWLGFIRTFQFEKGSLWPIDLPFLLDKGKETRIRDLRQISANRYLGSGFIMETKKENYGFVFIK
ncbi:MAG: VCBS repeat-containing protein [bacterium]|nr:VCBS repeat-containing protein [bacterium]